MGRIWLVGASVALLLFINVLEASVIPARDPLSTYVIKAQNKGSRAGEEYRLPQEVTPSRYKITVQPDFTTFTFKGSVAITVKANQDDIKIISLHYANMEITSKTVIDGESSLDIADDTYDEVTNIYKITLEQALDKTKDYVINIEYVGRLEDDMAGFYRSSYTNADGKLRWLASTQFEPTDARRAFPCFDEPALKAIFQINIVRPIDMRSISNALLKETTTPPGTVNLEQDVYEDTTVMSTYLVAFVVSDFKDLSTTENGIHYSVWARANAITQASYSVSISPGLIQFMEDFTGIKYELSKMDEAAIPDFSAGAMENWGLVTYRERLALFKDDTSTSSTKQGIASVIAHEFSHQWFGDLVSPYWWKFLWLNEGFATYFEYFATLGVEPHWRLEEQFVINPHQNALAVDALLATHPMTHDVYSPAEINSLLDSITYDKAGSIIRTAEHFLTHDTFVKGIQNYLTAMNHKAATDEDLLNAWENQQKEDGILPEGKNAVEILKTWVQQPGYPVITVTRNENGIHITQKRFLVTGETPEPPGSWWQVPISYTTKTALDFTNTKPKEWLTNEQMDIQLTLTAEEWIMLNIQETGFYRVLYDDVTYDLLTSYLKSGEYGKIHAINRAQLLDDSLNLARAGQLSYTKALELTTYLTQEEDYIPWASYFKGISFLDSRLAGSDIYERFKTYVVEMVGELYSTVGFFMLDKDEHTTKLNRVNTLTWACNYNHKACVQSASTLFHSWMGAVGSINMIAPDLRSVVYCTALGSGGNDEWRFLWDQYTTSDVSSDQVLILAALGCTKDTALLTEYLAKSITAESGIRMQDSVSVFTAVYNRAEGVDVALDFLINNYAQIKEYYTAMNAISRIITGIASRVTTPEQQTKFQDFVTAHQGDLGSATDAATSALETIRGNLAWLDKHRDEISGWLPPTPDSVITTTESPSTTPSSAGAMLFHPIMCIVSLVGYLVARY